MVCREKSYANAAVECSASRPSVKKAVKDFEAAVGRSLFVETAGKDLAATKFAQGLLVQVAPLARSLRRLGESVGALHAAGRILRAAAPGDFFKGGLFTDFLARLDLSHGFRPCFLKIEVKRFRMALLNAECDVYFGVGLREAGRLEAIDFGEVPWKALAPSGKTTGPLCSAGELRGKNWGIGAVGEPEAAQAVLDALRGAGAKCGRIVPEEEWRAIAEGAARAPRTATILVPDIGHREQGAGGPRLPGYRFTAVLRRNHPYAELQPRLLSLAQGGRHGH